MAKWVYMFSEGDMTMRNLLGGKGANLAEMKLHITDIKVSASEVANALYEAGLITPAYCLRAYPDNYPKVFNASDILNFKKRFYL